MEDWSSCVSGWILRTHRGRAGGTGSQGGDTPGGKNWLCLFCWGPVCASDMWLMDHPSLSLQPLPALLPTPGCGTCKVPFKL